MIGHSASNPNSVHVTDYSYGRAKNTHRLTGTEKANNKAKEIDWDAALQDPELRMWVQGARAGLSMQQIQTYLDYKKKTERKWHGNICG